MERIKAAGYMPAMAIALDALTTAIGLPRFVEGNPLLAWGPLAVPVNAALAVLLVYVLQRYACYVNSWYTDRYRLEDGRTP